MITIDFNQSLAPEEHRVSQSVLESIQGLVADELGSDIEGTLDAAFVSDAEIRRLNRMYRDKDEVTDVLSFSYLQDQSRHENIGEVVISYDQAVRQAQEGDIELEIIDLLVHGILHVLGQDHETPVESKKMFSIQDRIVAHIL